MEDDDDGYDSIDEDAELELSCALHDLALRVKTFEENMKDRFHPVDGDDEDEITEDIPEMDDCHHRLGGQASPKHSAHSSMKHRRKRSAKSAAKQQADEEDEYCDDEEEENEYDEYDDDADDVHGNHHEQKGQRRRERDDDDRWNDQEQKEELSELRQNIALLLQGMKAEAKALDLESRDEDEGGLGNQ